MMYPAPPTSSTEIAPSTGEMRQSRRWLNLNELIREMIVLLQDKAHWHSILIHTELDAALATVPADRVQLQQVLLNLMLNGIEAMKDMKGELAVTSNNTEDGQIQVAVADSGIGLPADKAERIFDPFFTTKVRAPVWDSPSAGGSSKLMLAASGRPATRAQAQHFISRCPPPQARMMKDIRHGQGCGVLRRRSEPGNRCGG